MFIYDIEMLCLKCDENSLYVFIFDVKILVNCFRLLDNSMNRMWDDICIRFV